VRKILTSGRVSRIVCATDAGREGELIFRYIYEAAGCRKPVSRLWISSLTPDAMVENATYHIVSSRSSPFVWKRTKPESAMSIGRCDIKPLPSHTLAVHSG
jgi:hypothetical protein